MAIGDLIRRQAGALASQSGSFGERPFLRFEEWRCNFREYYEESVRWANLFMQNRAAATTAGAAGDANAPFHVGVLLDNIPDYLFALGGAALAGAVLVGINNTKRGAHLARDIAHTDCAVLITEDKYLAHLQPVLPESGLSATQIFVSRRWQTADEPAAADSANRLRADSVDLSAALGRFGAVSDPQVRVSDQDIAVLIFTSGTITAPKAVMCSHGRLIETGNNIGLNVYQLGAHDAGYIAMPLFHANALMCGYMPALCCGVPIALARKFSKTRWLADIRRYGATFFNYTGKPLAYILSTPRQPDDHVNPLRVCFGNEGSAQVVAEFETRFGCRVVDVFGSSEGGVGVTRQPEDPPGSIGRPAFGILVVDEQGVEKPAAQFDAHGQLLNAEQCVGEIVNTQGRGWFEGYYKNPDAVAERTRNGWYWSGDLGYKDVAGYLYFAGRSLEWLRVDGENFLARPIEEILHRHPDITLAAVYGVPDADGGDRVMAALILRDGARFDPQQFSAFLAAQADLSPKWVPSFIRIATELPQTATAKILKTELRRQKFRPDLCSDALYWRAPGNAAFDSFAPAAYQRIAAQFARTGRQSLLDL